MDSYQIVCQIRSKVDQFLLNTFSSIDIAGPELNAEVIQQCPVMFACTHRSHIDYILLGIELHKMGFRKLRFAAGDNLTRLPYLGPRFKSWGAFTVSRDVGFERNYVRNLCNSVVEMIVKREQVIVFPEGGRSYSGSMLDLKNGILGAAVLAQAKNPHEDVFLVPMSVSYEFPPDLPYFKTLLNGKKFRKNGNSIFKRMFGNTLYFGADLIAYGLVFAAKYTKLKYGNAYVDYEGPVSVRSLVDLEANKIQKARDEFSAHRLSMQLVSDILYKKFLKLFRILPVHVLASVIKSEPQVSREQCEERIDAVIETLRKGSRNIRELEKISSAEIARQGLRLLLRLRAVQLKGSSIIIRKKNIIDYYAASVEAGS